MDAPEPQTALEHAAKHLEPGYVCPMHPAVVSAEPGSCPICGMDLVVKKAEPSPTGPSTSAATEGAPAITVSDAVVNQLGVRTAEVRRGTLRRSVEGFGSFVGSTVRGYRPSSRSAAAGGSDPASSSPSMLVIGQIFEREAPFVRQGQTARVRFPTLGAREWTGTVISLENQISQTTHTFQLRVSVDLQGATVPNGMTALVTVEVDPVADVLLVPRDAVIVTGKGARVIVAHGGGRFQPRQVEAEDLGDDEIVIRSGLREGERVVVSAQFLLDSEANLQAGLRRLGGGAPVAASKYELTMRGSGMSEEPTSASAIPAGALRQEAAPDGAVRGADVQADPMREAVTNHGVEPGGQEDEPKSDQTAVQGASQEAVMPGAHMGHPPMPSEDKPEQSSSHEAGHESVAR